ncbi:hypothetical protein BH10PLA1_BH10PLA1_04780 [soil metagenome]
MPSRTSTVSATTTKRRHNLSPVQPDVEFMDVPLSDKCPVVWTINEYDRPTSGHYDVHVGVEMGIVLSGRSRRLYSDFDFTTQPGNVWFAGLWEPHGMQILKPGTRHLVLGLLPEFLGVPDNSTGCDWMQLFRIPPRGRPQAKSARDRQAVLQYARRITDLMQSNDPFRLARLRMIVQEYLLFFMAAQESPSVKQNNAVPPANRASLLPALQLIDQHPTEKISLAHGARAAGMSRSKFAEQFHVQTGITFAKFLTRRRIGGVIGDLRGSDHKLQTVARRWGFADASHLVRVFKQHTGTTPDAYRKESGSRAPTTAKMPKPAI